MFRKLYVPEVHWRQLPPLLCLSFGALLGLLLAGFVLGGRYTQQQALLLEEYGTGMARAVANSSVDAALSRDLISLYALLQDAVQDSRVTMATVHDVDNILLVQAGQPQSDLPPRAFEADIRVDDNSVGRVTLTLNQGFVGDLAVRWTLLGTGLLLLIMVLMALYESYGSAWYWRRLVLPAAWASDEKPEAEPAWVPAFDASEASVGAEPSSDFSAEDALAAPLKTPVLQQSDLIVVLSNRKRLQQQLASERFNGLLEVFEQRLEEVLSLYGGVRVGQASAGVYCTRFSSTESFAEAAFRALCSAYLLQSLGERDRLRLQVLAQICAPESDIKLAVSDAGIYLQSGLEDVVWDGRLQLEPQDDGRQRLLCFEASYAALLQRQQQQLLAHEQGQAVEFDR